MPKIGDVVAAKYEVAKLIGEGGMGSVYMATHTMTGKQVALKWMLPELAKNEDAVHRFLREAQAAGRINHPNVVDIYDVGEHEDSPFLVMEYLHGEPLTEALERGGLSPGHVIDIILPCLRGVAAAHRKGVVHRDLKPDNIFLCTNEDGVYMQPKVLDFGISKLSGSDAHNPRLTRTGAVMGTPYYMSPEQIRGSHDVDGRCDVYAFGVILYEALTGQVPFNADTYSALVLEIATGVARPPTEVNPNIPEELAAVVMKAMAREPADRYPDITSLGVALEPFAESVRFTMERLDPTGSQRGLRLGTVTSTPFHTEHAVVPGKRSPVGFVVGGVALVTAVAASFFLFGSNADAPRAQDSAAAAAAAPTPSQSPEIPEDPGEHPAPATAFAEPLDGTTEGLPAGEQPPAEPAAPDVPQDGASSPTERADHAAQPESIERESEHAADADAADEDEDRPDSAKKKRRVRRKARPAPTPAPSLAAPPAKPQPPAPPKRNGRTGQLSIDEF